MRHTPSRDAADFGDTHAHFDPEPGARMVRSFFRRLRHLPLGDWVEAAARDAELGAALEAARTRLHARVERLPMARRRVTPRVQEVVSMTEGFVSRATAARMKSVALTAALALLARPELSGEDFHRLYEPFADVIPLHELEREAAAPSAAHATITPSPQQSTIA